MKELMGEDGLEENALRYAVYRIALEWISSCGTAFSEISKQATLAPPIGSSSFWDLLLRSLEISGTSEEPSEQGTWVRMVVVRNQGFIHQVTKVDEPDGHRWLLKGWVAARWLSRSGPNHCALGIVWVLLSSALAALERWRATYSSNYFFDGDTTPIASFSTLLASEFSGISLYLSLTFTNKIEL
jgi:hypothetical protein